ncbi:MAG: HD domain-containing protein, partial [Rhodospirillaceae bacterium]|nr:HD domain-containing protein [Rhodospirillaceae bacterium]
MVRREFLTATAAGVLAGLSMIEAAEAAEQTAIAALDRAVGLPWMCDVAAAGARVRASDPAETGAGGPRKRMLMGDDPRLPKMPAAPTLMDFFRLRFAPASHLLQSANLALKNGHDEKIVLACLLHDIGIAGVLRTDHGYWGAQLVAPYVDEEVSWAIRAHQALRFYADESVGYAYPKSYVALFGADYVPEPYIQQAYQQARAHRWYMSARLITVNDLYAFDPTVRVALDQFTDVIGRHFKQPKEGLGFDASPV